MAQIVRRQGISSSNVEHAAVFFCTTWQGERPFALQRFRSDRQSVFAELATEIGDNMLLQPGNYHFVFDALIEKLRFDVLNVREDGVPWRLGPRGKNGLVVVDPARWFGQPILDAAGVPVRIIVATYAANANQVDKVARWFDLHDEAVQAAIRYEESVWLASVRFYFERPQSPCRARSTGAVLRFMGHALDNARQRHSGRDPGDLAWIVGPGGGWD
jgi:uncharacterized protein (DUF433 family)